MKTVDIICRCEAGDTSKRRPPPDSNAARADSSSFSYFFRKVPITDIATRSSPTRSRERKPTLSISNLMIADHAALNGFDFRR